MSYEAFVGLRYFKGRKSSVFISIITVISILGVGVGVWALIVVLSVMGGFEGDLRGKILGTYAHVLVEREEGPFDGWRDSLARVQALPGVASAGPFLRNEVMASSPTNLAGVTVKGILPKLAAEVNGLRTSLTEGSLDYLLEPERIRRIGTLETGPGSPSLRTEALLPPPGEAVTEEIAEGGGPPGSSGAGQGGPAAPPEPELPVALMPPIPAPPDGERVLPGLLIGRELKRNLLVAVGDVVNLVSPIGDLGPSGPIPKARPFRVAGIFFTGMYEYDTKIVYATIEETQRFLAVGDEISGIEIRVPPGTEDDTDELVLRVTGALAAGHRVRDWRDLNRNLFAALKLERIAMFVILAFVVLVASFNIVSNLVLVVLEKAGEIAVLKSLGASNGGVVRIFIVQGLVIGILGTLIGLAGGLGTCLFVQRFGIPLDPDIYYIDQIPVVLDPYEILVTGISAVVISFLATLYPAWQAARLTPVEGLRLA
jgi:lipoprotein-releasing system permease protein